MLKLRKIKLQQLEKGRLSSSSMNQLFGGSVNCSCGCLYYGKPGGSSTASNAAANDAHGYTSPGYDPCGCAGPGHSELASLQAFWECKEP